jgi:hypothetical protein
VESDVWVPAQAMDSADTRELGIFVSEVVAEQDGQVLVMGEPWLDHIPVSDAIPWSPDARAWFYTRDHHLVDVWVWYLRFTELPAGLSWLALGPLALCALSIVYLWRLLRRSPAQTSAVAGALAETPVTPAVGRP